MYICHVWIVLAETTDEVDCGALSAKVENVKARLRETQLQVRPKEAVAQVNYDLVLQFSLSDNHGVSHAPLVDFLEWLARELPGSYGLAYWLDDERPGSMYFDGYRVIRVARGTLEHRFDPFLSPIRPVIEDECS